jgi:putative oxidoreductase
VHDIDAAMLVLRLSLGLIMFMHGYNHFFGGGRLPGAGRWFDSLGIRPGILHAWVVAVVEVVSGVLLGAGLFTPVAAAGAVGVLSVALIVVHWKNGFFVLKEGFEYAGLIIVVASMIGVVGPGEWSLDHAWFGWRDVHGWAGFGVSFGVGMAAALGLLAVFWRPPKKVPAA